MTVKELIRELQSMPQDAKVVTETNITYRVSLDSEENLVLIA